MFKHARSIAAAQHLAAEGHISASKRDSICAGCHAEIKSGAKGAKPAKPPKVGGAFGSLAPMALRGPSSKAK